MFSDLLHNLEALDAQGLLRRRRLLESAQGSQVEVDGHPYLAFCSNDYLGLANHPALAEALCESAKRYGVGAGASHLIVGHQTEHHRLERALAEFSRYPEALLFSTGYMANMGVVSALVGRDDTVFSDKLNHASLNDAIVLSRARMQRYRHGDLAQLEQQLASVRNGRKLVVTDAVFSMDGDIAPVPQLLTLCERYDAWLLLDDAHGFGVLGEQGRGTLEHFGLGSERIIYMATLGKAAGVLGAFVAAVPAVIETLIQRARTYVYTTAMPPPLAAALLTSLQLMRNDLWRRQRLQELVGQLQERLAVLRQWRLMPSQTPIQPLLIGGNQEAVRVSEALQREGILVPAIRPPTVPKGAARLRISLSAAHTPENVDQLCEALLRLERGLPSV
jgi:8-amino-7-oxononanoate synthase